MKLLKIFLIIGVSFLITGCGNHSFASILNSNSDDNTGKHGMSIEDEIYSILLQMTVSLSNNDLEDYLSHYYDFTKDDVESAKYTISTINDNSLTVNIDNLKFDSVNKERVIVTYDQIIKEGDSIEETIGEVETITETDENENEEYDPFDLTEEEIEQANYYDSISNYTQTFVYSDEEWLVTDIDINHTKHYNTNGNLYSMTKYKEDGSMSLEFYNDLGNIIEVNEYDKNNNLRQVKINDIDGELFSVTNYDEDGTISE